MSDTTQMAQCKGCGRQAPRDAMFGVQEDLRCASCAEGVRERMRTKQATGFQAATFWASKLILAICLGLFLVTDFLFRNGEPGWLLALQQAPPIWAGEWWRHLLPVFLHAGVLHIAMNGMAFWFLGRVIEMGFGPWPLIGMTLVTGVAGSASQWIFSAPTPGVGLSGAIFGYCGFLLAVRRHHPVAMRIMDKRMQNNIWAMLGIGFVLSFTGTMMIGNAAHVGGLVSGFALGLAWRLPYRKALMALVVVGTIGVVVAAHWLVLTREVPMGVTKPDGSFEVKETITGAEYRRRYLAGQYRD